LILIKITDINILDVHIIINYTYALKISESIITGREGGRERDGFNCLCVRNDRISGVGFFSIFFK